MLTPAGGATSGATPRRLDIAESDEDVVDREDEWDEGPDEVPSAVTRAFCPRVSFESKPNSSRQQTKSSERMSDEDEAASD